MDTRIQRCSPDIGFRGRIQQPRNFNVSVGRLSAGAPNCTDLPRRTRENSHESWNSRSSPTAVRSDRHRGDGCTGLCMPWHTPHAERTVFRPSACQNVRLVYARAYTRCRIPHRSTEFRHGTPCYACRSIQNETAQTGWNSTAGNDQPPRFRHGRVWPTANTPYFQDAEQKGKPHAHRIRVHGACAFSFRPRLELTDGTRNQASAAVSSGMPGPIVEVMVALVM